MADASGLLPRTLGGTRVLVNGNAVPLTYASATQVNAVLPFGLTAGERFDIRVETDGALSDVLRFLVVESAPAIFNYSTQGHPTSWRAIVVNQDGSLNSEFNRAPNGSIISIFATGVGKMTPTPDDGRIVTSPGGSPLGEVQVNPGSATRAEILYAGHVPGTAPGVVQFNIRLTDDGLQQPTGMGIRLRIGSGVSEGYFFYVRP